MKMNNHYSTKDLSESAFLYSSGKKLAKLDRTDGKVWFVFEDKISCEELSNSFWRKDALVNAKEFADAIRTLKGLIFNK